MSLRSEDGRLLKSKNPTVIGRDGTTLLEPGASTEAHPEIKFPSWATPLLIVAGGIGLVFGVFILWLIATFLAVWVVFSSVRTPKQR